MTQVFLVQDDVDPHGLGCHCGLCNRAGKSFGVGIFDAAKYNLDNCGLGDPLTRIYAPSPEAALHNAGLEAANQGWEVVPAPEPEAESAHVALSSGWQVHLLVDADGHLNLYVNNDDGSDMIEVDTGQGDGGQGEQLAFRVTTTQIEAEYQRTS